MYFNKDTGEYDIEELKLEGDDKKCLKVTDPELYAQEGCSGCSNMNACIPYQ